jgi:O-antigen/teichoic acid export membrane protein
VLRDFFKAAGLILGSTVAAQLVVVAASPVLSRLYEPSDFGVLATASGLVSILAIGASLRLEEVLPLIRSDRIARLAAGLGLTVATILGVSVVLPVYLFGRNAGIPATDGVLVAFTLCVALAVALAGYYSTLAGARLRSQSFGSVARANVDKVLGQLAIQLGGGLLGAGAVALLLAKVAEKGIGIRRLWRLSPPATSPRAVSRSIRRHRALLHRYRDLVGFGLVAALSRGVRIGVVAPLITVFWGVAMAGIFALAYRALVAPFLLVGGASLQAFLGVTSQKPLPPSPRLRGLLMQATGAWVAGSVLIFLVMAETGEPLFAWAFGEAWRPAGTLAPYLAIMGTAFAFSFPLQRLYDIWGLVRIRMAFEASQSVAVVATLVWCGAAGASLPSAVALLSGLSVLFAVLTVLHLSSIRATRLPAERR